MSAYEKFAHPASGYAVVGVCAVVELDKKGSCKQARLAATGVCDHPIRLSSLETALKGQPWSVDSIRTACAKADVDVKDVREDLFAKEDYRRHLLRVVAQRAAERAGAG
jgi:carbon-monoxide dehydrogenase medium subunit